MDQKTCEKMHYLDNLNLANDREASNSMKLDFARVNIFNPYDQNAYQKLYDFMRAGNPVQKEIYRVWRYGGDEFVHRNKFSLIDRKGHYRKNKFYYKHFTVHEELSPLSARAYALSRYRQRTGQFLDKADYWLPLPELIGNPEGTVRQDILLPTKTGAWLGYPCLSKNAYWEYNGKKELLVCGEYQSWQFKALTYINRSDMFDWQIEICDLHQQGRSEEANNIQLEYINSNQILTY